MYIIIQNKNFKSLLVIDIRIMFEIEYFFSYIDKEIIIYILII